MVDLVIWLFGALRVGGKREREHLRHHTLSQREKVRPASITQMQHVNRERWVWSCKKGVWLRLHFVYSQEAHLCNPLLLKKTLAIKNNNYWLCFGEKTPRQRSLHLELKQQNPVKSSAVIGSDGGLHPAIQRFSTSANGRLRNSFWYDGCVFKSNLV